MAEKKPTARQRRSALDRDVGRLIELEGQIKDAQRWATEDLPAATQRGYNLMRQEGEPVNRSVVVRWQYVNVAWALLDMFPETWPGAATVPTHDHA